MSEPETVVRWWIRHVIVPVGVPVLTLCLGFFLPELMDVVKPVSWLDGAWTGIAAEIDQDGRRILSSESVHLKTKGTTVVGRIQPGSADRGWQLSGYLSAERILALAYRSVVPGRIGAGNYFLENTGSGQFIGHWTGVDCDHQEVMQCPYVLTRETLPHAKTQWADHLTLPCRRFALVNGCDLSARPTLGQTTAVTVVDASQEQIH